MTFTDRKDRQEFVAALKAILDYHDREQQQLSMWLMAYGTEVLVNIPAPRDGHCAIPSCEKTFQDHRWGRIRANSLGWFFQLNGMNWCPDHIPDWVPAWRERKRREADQAYGNTKRAEV